MAGLRSDAPARQGRPLALNVLLPLIVAAALMAAAIAMLASGSGRSAADKELDARAATVKKLFDASGRPDDRRALRRLSRRAGAELTIVRGADKAAPVTKGDTREYRYPLRGGKQSLRVVLPTTASGDELSKGFTSAVMAAVGGVLLLLLLGGALLKTAAGGPARGLAGAIARINSGDHAARAPVSGAAELREASTAFNVLAARAAQLDQAIGTDPITGLPNAERFGQALEVELKRAAREQIPLALVLLDLDNFKAVNDAHGKAAGDQLLRQIADALRPCLRATDVLSRVSGDEFGMVLPKANATHAEMILGRARAALDELKVEGFKLGFSAGYAIYPSDARDGQTLMQAGEGALRAASRGGKGEIRRFDPGEVSVAHTEGERSEVTAIMKDPEGITPVFQPLVALATGQISGFEALTRFKQPPKRRPDEWFLLAQRVGLGPALEAAAIQAALNAPARPPGTYLSLNLSPSTLAAPEVQAVLPQDLTGLVIEITEHELAEDDSILSADLATLRERGARIAVDDAGAGYAGLQQLMRVQPDLIKLDRSLVTDVDSDPAKQALVDSFVRFGRRTGAQVVAEGIETEEELRMLADLDVNYGQGYFLAKPGPAWPSISPWIGEKLLRRSLGGANVEEIAQLPVGSDQRLAAVCGRIARIASVEELRGLSPVIADELGADEVIIFMSGQPNTLNSITARDWLPTGGRLDLAHFPEFNGVLRSGEPEQFLTGRGSGTTTGMGEIALLANSGYESMLTVPVGGHGMLQALSALERPWGRAQTNRALVIAYQLSPVLRSLAPAIA